MSNGHKLELLTGKNETFLNYWDWIAGRDVVFILRDGKTYKRVGDKEIEVSLDKEIPKLAKRLDKQVDKFYEGRK